MKEKNTQASQLLKPDRPPRRTTPAIALALLMTWLLRKKSVIERTTGRAWLLVSLVVGVCLIFGSVGLQRIPVEAQSLCTCDNTSSSICSTQGFQITLVSFSIDQQAGTSTWDYEVCNDSGLEGACVPPKDLSHVDINLPGLGPCLTASHIVTITQVDGFGNATLVCGVSEKDPSCDIFGTVGVDFVGKCDVAGGTLDPGECVVMRLSIAGAESTLGAGPAMTVTKAGPECASDCILGPSCEPCLANQPPVAICQDVTVPAGANCLANASVDDGSFDPDGDPIDIMQDPPGPYPLGMTTVTLTVTDEAGETDTCVAKVTVVDDTPPTITCPTDIAVEGASSEGEVVEFATIVMDNCDPDPTVFCIPASGSTFDLGTTMVTCTATDADGNAAVCTFAVEVAPFMSLPTLTSCPIQVDLENPARPSLAPTQEQPTAQALLVADFHLNQVSVLLTEGNGKFKRHSIVPTGDGPTALAQGDINMDGWTDAVVANLLSDNISVLLGDGAGHFERHRSIPVGDQPTDVIIGDVTGDDLPDLAVTNFGDHTVSVLRGNGDGTFQVVNTFEVGTNPTGLTAGDFNEDGWLDLATSNFGSSDVTILRNRGEGRFFVVQTVPVGLGPMDIIAGDFDDDGRLDLATANFLSDDVSLLMGDHNPDKTSQGDAGSSRFRVGRTLLMGEGPVRMVTGLFLTNRLGLGVANWGSGEVSIWVGDERGLPNLPQRLNITPTPVALTPGDFNGDGRLDLAVLDLDGVTLRVLLDNGDGKFRLAR